MFFFFLTKAETSIVTISFWFFMLDDSTMTNPHRISTSCHIKNIQHLQHSKLKVHLSVFGMKILYIFISLFFSSSFRYSHNHKLCVIMRPIFCIIDPHDFYQSLSSMKISKSKFYGCKKKGKNKSFVQVKAEYYGRVRLIMIF